MTILARRCSLASLGIALLLASCRARTADVSGPRSDLAEIRTDRTTYVLGSKNGRYVFADTVVVRFVNRSSVPLYFQVCGQKDESVPAGAVGTRPISEIVRVGADTTGIDFRFAWACVGDVDHLMVAPGAVLLDSVWLVTTRDEGRRCARGPGNCSPPSPRSHTTGWFHIEYRIYTGQRGDPAARQLPREARRTNPFDVRWRE
jgi:hypothetical protein